MSNSTKMLLVVSFLGAAFSAIGLNPITFAFNLVLFLLWATFGGKDIIAQEQRKERIEEWQKT